MDSNTVIVFGASGDIGKSIIRSLKKTSGVANIIGTFCNNKPKNNDCHWIHYDAIQTTEEELKKILGPLIVTKYVSIVFCIAIPSTKKEVSKTPYTEWRNLFEVNCFSFVRIFTALQSILRKKKSRIVVVSSDTTEKNAQKNGVYTASKKALESVAVTIAKEEQRFGIKINVIAPSLVKSKLSNKILELKGITDKSAYYKMLPGGRPIYLKEISDAIVSITIDKHWSFVTGQIFRFTTV